MEEMEVKEMFCMIDKKHRGRVTCRQLRKFLRRHDAKFSRRSVKVYVRSIDSDGDGKLTLDDFMRALTKCDGTK
ncbi:unnamed protein product [Schistosoma turkestanicum]|nr:unnamed protein product [Schistosoma turkestanicum]